MKRDILLKDFKPRTALVLEDNTPKFAKFPVIDSHNHLGEFGQSISKFHGHKWYSPKEIVDRMDQLNIVTIINLDGGWGDELKNNLDLYKSNYPERFAVFCWVDWEKIDQPNFAENWVKKLTDAVASGAQGLKVFKKLGLEYRDKKGSLILPDDPRLDPIWEAAGHLKIPVLIHSADPIAFFWPLDEFNERLEELKDHPDWHFFGKDYPSFNSLIESQLKVIARHKNTTFISAHILSNSENLRYVAEVLNQFPNLYVDIGERIGEIGRQPYTSHWFFTKYADRILFGTDIPMDPRTYQIYFRCLETQDEYFDYGRNQGRYKIYGLNLSDSALKKIYFSTASKIIPGIADNLKSYLKLKGGI
jgi:predicted TIM-barrel fold metal-dependent hydrolase